MHLVNFAETNGAASIVLVLSKANPEKSKALPINKIREFLQDV